MSLIDGGDDERPRVPHGVGRGEVRVREDGPPQPAHRAQSAEELGGEAQQNLVHEEVQGQSPDVERGEGAPLRCGVRLERRRHRWDREEKGIFVRSKHIEEKSYLRDRRRRKRLTGRSWLVHVPELTGGVTIGAVVGGGEDFYSSIAPREGQVRLGMAVGKVHNGIRSHTHNH